MLRHPLGSWVNLNDGFPASARMNISHPVRLKFIEDKQPTQQQMINDPAKYSEQYRHSMASAEYRKWYYTPHYFDPDGNPITAQQHQELENQGAYNY